MRGQDSPERARRAARATPTGAGCRRHGRRRRLAPRQRRTCRSAVRPHPRDLPTGTPESLGRCLDHPRCLPNSRELVDRAIRCHFQTAELANGHERRPQVLSHSRMLLGAVGTRFWECRHLLPQLLLRQPDSSDQHHTNDRSAFRFGVWCARAAADWGRGRTLLVPEDPFGIGRAVKSGRPGGGATRGGRTHQELRARAEVV